MRQGKLPAYIFDVSKVRTSFSLLLKIQFILKSVFKNYHVASSKVTIFLYMPFIHFQLTVMWKLAAYLFDVGGHIFFGDGLCWNGTSSSLLRLKLWRVWHGRFCILALGIWRHWHCFCLTTSRLQEKKENKLRNLIQSTCLFTKHDLLLQGHRY